MVDQFPPPNPADRMNYAQPVSFQASQAIGDIALGVPAQEVEPGTLNWSHLQKLTDILSIKGGLFGHDKDYELTAEDRMQLKLAADKAREQTAEALETSQWQLFEDLQGEGSKKGVLFSATSHPGTAVPTWCVDGGNEAKVKKVIREGGTPGIQVPSDVFQVFNARKAADSVEQYANWSLKMMRGMNTTSLAKYLKILENSVLGEVDRLT